MIRAAVALACLALGSPLLWWTFDRQPGILFYDGIVMADSVAPGSAAPIKWGRAVVLKTGCEVYFERKIVTATNDIHPKERLRSAIERYPVGEHRDVVARVPMYFPETVTPGPAAISAIITTYCNPVQHALNWPVVYETSKFMILIKK